MIFSDIDSLLKRHDLGNGVKKALEFLSVANLEGVNNGKHELEGEDLFFIVDSYSTKSESLCKLERHKKYIDVHYVVSGVEMIGYAQHKKQRLYKSYDAVNDYALYDGDVSFISLKPDKVAIFFPEDLHMPGIGDGKETLKKIVVKVKI